MNFLSAFPEEEKSIPEEFGGINPTSKKKLKCRNDSTSSNLMVFLMLDFSKWWSLVVCCCLLRFVAQESI
jgi:hypothetical protein